jgi:Na+-transporting NADH:ubiquinone oxidoreductase subunit NqrF
VLLKVSKFYQTIRRHFPKKRFEPQPQEQAILFMNLRVSSPPPHAQDERKVDISGTVNLLYVSLNNA